MNSEDDSYLRMAFVDRCDGEYLNLQRLIPDDEILRATYLDWLDWVASCECTWDVGEEIGGERYPTHRHHPGIDSRCWVHGVITACNDFILLLDDDWKRIADWYRLPSGRPTTVSGEALYGEWGKMDY